MITRAASERMVVISDLHLGNPFSSVRRRTVEFIDWAAAHGYDICINGDGFDVAQVSLDRFTHDVPEVLGALRAAVDNGRQVFYVVGNHDIVFEHFLTDWAGFKLAPLPQPRVRRRALPRGARPPLRSVLRALPAPLRLLHLARRLRPQAPPAPLPRVDPLREA